MGWSVCNRMKKDRSVRALEIAIASWLQVNEDIHQSDLGRQYGPINSRLGYVNGDSKYQYWAEATVIVKQ